MKNKSKFSLGLILKVLVILALPLLLFRYVDSQPAAIASDDEGEETRSVAIVDEDNGVEMNDEQVTLGSEIPSLLREREDYSWTVVNRSAAEQGFSNQNYDAIIYIPSDYSKNVMTFKEDKPEKASINYVIQPNLKAKNRQRLHKEMALAKNMINKEMATIYWSYVSQEVDHIRGQFDKILEKEIDFQEAMHSFYSPSSRSLANEIDQHKSNLENILNQTTQIDDVTGNNVDTAATAEEKMAEFAEALERYKNLQQEQEELLGQYLLENEEAIASGIERNKSLEKDLNNLHDILTNQFTLHDKNNDKVLTQFSRINDNIKDGDGIIDKWSNNSNELEEQFKAFNVEIKSTFSQKFLDGIFQDVVKKAEGELDNAIKKIKNAPIDAGVVIPLEPEETVSFEALKGQMEQLGQDIGDVDPELIPEVLQSYEKLQEELGNLKKEYNNNSDVKKDYAENLKNITNKLMKIKSDSKMSIVENINEKQNEIELPDKNLGDLSKKTTNSLIDYLNALTVFHTIQSQKLIVDEELARTIEKMQEENHDAMIKLFDTNTTYREDLAKLLGNVEMTDAKNVNINAKTEDDQSFTEIVEKAKENLKSYNEQIKSNKESSAGLLDQLEQGANLISNQLTEVNNQTFNQEDSPSFENLNGEMVFNNQQNTLTNMENLSELVASLEESQENITSSTTELQAKVGDVQQQSDELNNKWSTNVESTQLVKDDVYDILGNTVVDGQTNPVIYNYLANPVNVEGQVDGKVLSESDDRLPPVIMLIAILISGLLIGFISHYYSNSSYLVQGGLFILLNLAGGLIISIYGLNIYNLDDAQAIQWSFFTILLLLACSNIVRAGLFINPFVGWLASIAMIIFFITPLIDIVVPEFSFGNPIASVYMGLQYGMKSPIVLTMIALTFIILLVSAFIYTVQIIRNKSKVDQHEEMAS